MKLSATLKIFLFATILMVAGTSAQAQYSKWLYVTPRKYVLSVTLTNPATAMIKMGGGIEYHKYWKSYQVLYTMYMGAYYGKQVEAEWRKYTKYEREHKRNDWRYRDFLYIREVTGRISYDGNKFSPLNQKEDVQVGERDYIGIGLGYGRKYTYNNFFVTVKGGLKGTVFLNLIDNDKQSFRQAYVIGPANIIEFNVQMGLTFYSKKG